MYKTIIKNELHISKSVELLAMDDHGSCAVSNGSAEKGGPHSSSEFHDVVGIRLHTYLLTEGNGYWGHYAGRE